MIGSEFDLSDVDVGTNVAVQGLLRDTGLPGTVLMTRRTGKWEQRGLWTTSHLSRDYVSGERLTEILENWTPFDFIKAEATIISQEEKEVLWKDFADGLKQWRV